MSPHPDFNLWKLADGRAIRLLTPAELKTAPNGTELWTVNGEKAVVGTDYIDLDTRFGYLAYGLLETT